MKHLLCLGVLLVAVAPGCGASTSEEGSGPASSVAEVSADFSTGEGDLPAAVLTVSLMPLRDGLAASVHRGPSRGVRRVLKGVDIPSAITSTATAQRGAAVFEERSDLCPTCGLLEATVEVAFGTFSPPLRDQGIQPLGTGSVHVTVPVRSEAAASMSRPGWWEVRLVRDPAIPSSAEWVRQPTTLEGNDLSDPLIALGLEVAEAEAALLPQRSPLLELRPWPSGLAPWRVDRVGLRLSKRLVELQLFVGPGVVRAHGASAASVVVLGSEFQMTASAELASQLGQIEEKGDPQPGREVLETVLLADARGRLGKVNYSGPDGQTLLFSGSFTRSPKTKELSLPQKPRRPGATGRLPRPRLR